MLDRVVHVKNKCWIELSWPMRQLWLACYCRGVILAARCLFDDHDCEISKSVKTSVNCCKESYASEAREASLTRPTGVWAFLASLPSPALCFSASFQTFCLTACAYLNTQNSDCLQSKGLFIWRWGTPGRWGNPLRWGNPPVHIISHFNVMIITFTC